VIDNASFEITPNGVLLPPWVMVQNPSDGNPPPATYSWSDSGGAQSGNGFLDLWYATAYSATVSQVVSPLPDGTYTVSAWYQGGTGANTYVEQYMFVRGHDAANELTEIKVPTTPSTPFIQLTIPNIVVTSGEIEIGFFSNGNGGAWSHFDNVQLTLVTP
jgi:arabinogalactan endo-1,4-beta-galactosidase